MATLTPPSSAAGLIRYDTRDSTSAHPPAALWR
jgi:hypothetical protein